MIKAVKSWKTSDGKLFNIDEQTEAKRHENLLRIERLEKKFMKEARKVFNIPKPTHDEDGDTDEDMFVEELMESGIGDFEDFEEFSSHLISLLMLYPVEVEKMLEYTRKF